MVKRRFGALLLVFTCLLSAGCLNLGLVPTEIERVTVEESGRWLEPYRVALIDIDGYLGTADSWLLGGTTVADLKEKLSRARQDWRVKAVVLRINSGGGAVSASEAMYREVKKFSEETGKPVVASMMGTAASGAYYTALGADHIVASPSTVTGSVGVIMHFINIQGLYNKLGLQPHVIKSGEKKDMGSPTREMTAEEKRIMEGIMKSLFENFVAAVRSERSDMSDEDISTISDGRVVNAEDALNLHMVDSIGHLDGAIKKAQELAGISDSNVVMYRAWPHYNSNIYSKTSSRAAGPDVLAEGLKMFLRRRGPVFLYMWWPAM